MRLFDPDSFVNIAVHSYQAVEIAKVCDKLLEKASFVLYGKFNGKLYFDFSTVQKATDTHVILAYAPKKLAD